jgi:hypothetical protein
MKPTPRSIPIPAKIAFAGGKGWRIEGITRCMLVERVKAYQTDPLTKNATSREDMQDINSPLEPCHELAIVPSKVTEMRFLLKDIDDGVGRLAIYEFVDDLMLEQVGPCLFFELLQGGFKEWFEVWGGIDGHGVGRDGRQLWYLGAVHQIVIDRRACSWVKGARYLKRIDNRPQYFKLQLS